MNPFILYSKKSRITGRMLRDELEISGGIYPPSSNVNMLICWGMSNGDISNLRLGEGKVCILNHPDNSKVATNKLNALKKMRENGVSVPPFQTTEDIAQNGLTIKFPMIGRTSTHQGGSGLFMCNRYTGSAERRGASHFLQFIPSQSEYRVHIFMDKIVRIQEKVPSEETPLTNNTIRNHRYGWRFAWRPYEDKNYPREVVDEAIKAVKALKLEFGAVDVLWSNDNKPYVLEVNTAPALDGSGIESYAKRINEYMEKISAKLGD